MLPPVFKFITDPCDGRLFKAQVFEGVATVRWTDEVGGELINECRYYSTQTVAQHIASGVWKIIKEEDNETGKTV